jgi:hypothetical protein
VIVLLLQALAIALIFILLPLRHNASNAYDIKAAGIWSNIISWLNAGNILLVLWSFWSETGGPFIVHQHGGQPTT